MERHRCKLCYRKFSNGRALGGHMRSHMMNLPIPPKQHPPPPPQPPPSSPRCETESSSPFATSSSSSSDSERQLVTLLQDRESETESFKKNPTRKRRSMRIIQKPSLDYQHYYDIEGYHHLKNSTAVQEVDPPVSSISEVTSDEDIAFCLMMMSRDNWNSICTSPSSTTTTRFKKKYECETCNKVFRSYQALGGHRASHKKARVNESDKQVDEEDDEEQRKVHECPVCLRVFASGQALGGHKRSHVFINGGVNIGIQKFTPISNLQDRKKIISFTNNNNNESLIDLNLPAPVDDDYDQDYDDGEEISQIAVSAVSQVQQ